MKKLVLLTSLAMGATLAIAEHPDPQPRPAMSTMTTSADGKTFFVNTGESPLPANLNQLNYVESDVFDGNRVRMLNTLPSTPTNMFNLHAGAVVTSNINKTSPKDDLNAALNAIESAASQGTLDQANIRFALDVLEGNPIPSRRYSGFALLHYTAGERVKSVVPITDANGVVIGGNVNIHQVWYDNHIESDTSMIDVSAVKDVPWTVTYTIDVLTGGADDWSPFVMYWDDPALSMPGMPPMPHVGMDASFFPMGDGKSYTIKLKHAQGKYYNLTYTWGWRQHPPRVQATENASKMVNGINLKQWEINTFGENPRSSETAKLAAIAKIGNLAPAKRMWQSLKDAQTASPAQVVSLMQDAKLSLADWSDRRRLPRGVVADPNSNLTLFYVNNTIYGSSSQKFDWTTRGSVFKVALKNGDNFDHGYVNVDFGGSRGWENQFQFGGGPGASFTFGRAHWWMNTPLPLNAIMIPQAAPDGTPTQRNVELKLNYDRPARLSLYHFDPLHHDVAVYSIH